MSFKPNTKFETAEIRNKPGTRNLEPGTIFSIPLSL